MPSHSTLLVRRFGDAADLLAPVLGAFGPDQLRAWCASLGEPTFVGSSGRVFPASFRATPLLRAWLVRLADLGVVIKTGHRWTGWARSADGTIDTRRLLFVDNNGATRGVTGDVTILALGGASWPRVGSDGRWTAALEHAGVHIAALRPANCAVRLAWSADFAERFGGVPVKNVAVTVDATSVRGEAMITEDGLEGGPVYAHSAAIRDSIDRNRFCSISIDLYPDLSSARLVERLGKRRAKDSLSATLRRVGLQPVATALLREVTGNQVPREPERLAALIKSLPIVVRETTPIDRAISTAGGVSFSELDTSMMIRRLPGTFVAGEMIEWEAPTGGYLLQASFSTGVAAARGALQWLSSNPG